MPFPGNKSGGVLLCPGFLAGKWILLLLGSLLLASCGQQKAPFHGTDISGAAFGRQLTLIDHDGRPAALADFRGKAVVLFFGYTSCPDICPTTLSRYAEVMKTLGPEAERVQVLFVTLDPGRDTPARLKEYVPWFHPSFVGLTGSTTEIAEAAREFRVFSAIKEVGGGMGYVLDHSAGSYVFDPAGKLRLFLNDTATVPDTVADLRRLLAGQ